MGKKCCVPGCNSNYDNTGVYISSFKFPREETRRHLWINKINRENFIPSATAVVCIKHFSDCFIIREDRVVRDDGSLLIVPRNAPKLRNDAYPSIFPNQPSYLSSDPTQKRKNPSERHEKLIQRDEENFLTYGSNDIISSFEELKKDYKSSTMEIEDEEVFEMPMSNAEKCKNYRNRKKAANNNKKKVAKTKAEYNRTYRLRKKPLAHGYQSSTNQVLNTPLTSNSSVTFGPSPLPVTIAPSTSVTTITNVVTSASQICPTVPVKLEIDKIKPETEKSLLSKGIQRQRELNERTVKILGAILKKVSQGQSVLVVPSKQDIKDVRGTSVLSKVSPDINPVSSSRLLVNNTIQESCNYFQDSNKTVVSQYNQSVKSFQKTSDVTKDINTSLQTINTVKDCSTISIASRDSFTQPLVSNAAQSSVTADKIHQSSIFVDIAKETSQPLPDFCISQNKSLKTVSKETKISDRDIIEFDYLFKMFKLINQHSKSGCNLNDMIITRKSKVGLRTYYSLKCTVCDYKNNLCSETRTLEDSINADAIEGMLNINCNLDDMNKLLLNMKLAPIGESVFIKEFNKKERVYPKKNLSIHSISSEIFDKSSEQRPQDAAFEVSEFPKKTYSKTAKVLRENLTQKSKSITDLISDLSGLNKSFEQVLSNNVLVVEDQFEVEEERNYTECEDNSEVMLSQHILKFPNNKPVNGEDHALLNTTKIKQEIDLDMYEKELTQPEINKEEMLNNNLGCDDQLKGISSHQKQIGACNNKLVVDEGQIKLYKTLVKQEIQDDSSFLEPGDIGTEYGDNSELTLPHPILKVPNNKRVSGEDHTLLNTKRIKQEIDLDIYEKGLGKPESNNGNKFIDLMLDSSGLYKSFEQVVSNRVLVVEDQFEEEEERNNTEHRNKSEVMLSQYVLKMPNNKPVVDENHTVLNTIRIKQEIDFDMYEK